MSIWSRFTQRRRRKIEEQRNAAVARAMARGDSPEEAAAAGDRAARGDTATTMFRISNI